MSYHSASRTLREVRDLVRVDPVVGVRPLRGLRRLNAGPTVFGSRIRALSSGLFTVRVPVVRISARLRSGHSPVPASHRSHLVEQLILSLLPLGLFVNLKK